MTKSSSRSSLADVDTDKLFALSERWVNESQKRNNPKTKLDVIRTLESGIRALINSGYTYEEVSKKLTGELEVEISAQIIRKYLQRIDEENKTAITKAKRDLKKSTKDLNANAHHALPSASAKFLDDESRTSTTNQTVIDATKTSIRLNSDSKQTAYAESSSKPKSIVPKSVPVDDDEDDNYLEQQKILKHYNRY